ncbi:flagellar basal-body rod protein FlgC [Brevibacillus reuszeri]|uniref:Flagellar basal-body rod protein FlgC n=1 Tax=Brevibacillus reuszeri TaxID=54915 RepID=A0A0K9YWV7_9BACL|nr:flagellar basal body rod protein FlgC [Brevibacillus reuszeri]KNB72720.1 flagellar basal body rod protein FlgC [Brevibacillus reuszeri]MED1860575.1 flagellar basal body rod protein FlgC [Brevibacillus reuszeri]GED70244.1 flagellar basal-body rod protein FlgC [Brevibacillus reuszeri]
MSLFQGMNASVSALTANRLMMDTISANLANAESTRSTYVNGAWQPYKRKMLELTPRSGNSFDNMLQMAVGNVYNSNGGELGVRVTAIREDNTPFKRMYDPSHPDADADGYVLMPNVDPMKEFVDLIAASRAYEANVTAFNASKSMMMKALEIR